MERLVNTERLPDRAREKVGGYLPEMLSLLGANCVSAAVYGSAASRDYVPGTSDVNIVFVCRNVDLPALRKCLKLVDRGIRNGIAAPLMVTRDYLANSADAFPIELLDMKERHVTVYGADILSDLDIHPDNLRLECEQQVKGKLLRIRQAYLEVGLRRHGIEALLKRSLNDLIPAFRNLLRLRGEPADIGKREILARLCDLFHLEHSVFLDLWHDRTEDEKIGKETAHVFMRSYLEQLDKLANAIDSL